MVKKLLSIISIGAFLFTACKKDSQINPPTTPEPVVVTPPPPVPITDNVYPNPYSTTFTIETNSIDSQTVQIIDMLGSIKLTIIINGTTAIFDNGLANGIYILEITNRTGTIKKKMIKQ